MSKKIEDGLTPQQRYQKNNKKRYSIDCIISTEQDIIDWIESQSNKAGAIKKLIRADIERNKNN